ncbi:TolC family protein, partial [Candidatus Sumerlaeota bacterium]|nr:TolC family protein [Candidatus Sumerlaeota bacterium]
PLPIAILPPEARTTGPLTFNIQEAVLQGLENNRAFRVQRFSPALRRLNEQTERAVFDPSITGNASYSRTNTNRSAPADTTSKRASGSVGLNQFLPTGTDLSLDLSTQRSRTSGASSDYASEVQFSVAQSLLRGGGPNAIAVNLASLRQARLDTQISEYELRGLAASQVSQIAQTCWGYVLAQRQMKIYEQSLALAEQQLDESQERVSVGQLAPTEMAAAQAEVALRRQSLINARGALDTTRLRLLRLINPPTPNLWDRDVAVLDRPEDVGEVTVGPVEGYIKDALRMRPDLNQARLAIQSDDIELVRTRNGLLPRLDLFITLGGTGYAGSFGGSIGSNDGHTRNNAVSVNFEYPLLNRAARARHQRALLSRDQAEEALANVTQLVETDVRTAHVQVLTAKNQIPATRATLKAQEESWRVESEKFRVGKSTSILVTRAARDLLSAQIDEIRAVIDYLQALVDLYRLDGSLLGRQGIDAPGAGPPSELQARK